ncbi:probable sugar phosphate/phosphate translocator at1g06470 [Phtheirospermum japonicum]|uniref:Probable sugar phosphate/phosphate translocator at1g06470 n=1 Tax=Phtheirospermum japonicum TaxID=374723 RepID=A0A830BVD8_9LAMI|nr:probable sugar phosphate/phosphate translocator at1g06470 [Phtheirospermum japonicum]
MVKKNPETDDLTNSKNEKLVIRRDPSFSGWCDEAGVPLPSQSENEDVNEDDFDFRSPSNHPSGPKNEVLDGERFFRSSDLRQTMDRRVDTNNGASMNGLRDQNETYVPFDIEDEPDVERYASRGEKTESPISVADVLKTLFLILVWYTFSTFLTLLPFTVVPTALSTAMDVNLSNASLVFISVTFATMCKSASPIFLLLFAFAFRLESPSVKLLGIMLVISVGILLTVAKETEFEFWGFIFVTLAAVMSGFRWTMTQILLQKESYGLKNPLTLMSYVTPVMAIATALLSLMLDPWNEFRTSDYFNSSWHIVRSSLLMLFGGTLAFFMVLTEYILVSVTSAVTVTIAGVVKEAVTILVAVLYFHDEFTWLKGVGLLTIMVGVSLFNWYKYLKLKKGETTAPTDSSKYVILDEMADEEDGAA